MHLHLLAIPELFIALATSLAVATPSVVGTVTFPSGVDVSADVFTPYFTTPFAATLAVVKFPSVKFNPSDSLTSCLVVSPFAV